MAICRPGSPSSMNRAATSLIRVAPLVMTTNWITTRMAKRIAPTTTWSPATNSPNARITPPAASSRDVPPLVRISRVVATLSTSRVRVVVRRIVGKALKSCGVRIVSVVRSTITARVRLADWSRSSTAGGTGTTNTRIAPTIVTGRITPASRDQPVASALDVVGGIPSPPQLWGQRPGSKTCGSARGAGERPCSTAVRIVSSHGLGPIALGYGSRSGDEPQTCGGTIPPIGPGVQTETCGRPPLGARQPLRVLSPGRKRQ